MKRFYDLPRMKKEVLKLQFVITRKNNKLKQYYLSLRRDTPAHWLSSVFLEKNIISRRLKDNQGDR